MAVSPSPTSTTSSPSAPSAAPDESYTAKLLAAGPGHGAKKLGEEAVEAVIAAVQGDTKALMMESGRCALSSLGRASRPRRSVAGCARRTRAPDGAVRPRRKRRRGRRARARRPRPGARSRPAWTSVCRRVDADGRALALPRRSRRDEWAALRADTPLTLTVDDLTQDPVAQRPDLARGGRRDLPAAVAPALALRRRDAGPVQGDAALPLAEDGKVPYIIGIAGSVAVGQVDHRARAEGAAVALAEHAEGRARHHRRLPASQRRAASARA